jgi:hypothetical protein
MPFSPPPPPRNVGDRTTQNGRVYVWDGYAYGLATDGQIATVPDGAITDAKVAPGISPTKINQIGAYAASRIFR